MPWFKSKGRVTTILTIIITSVLIDLCGRNVVRADANQCPRGWVPYRTSNVCLRAFFPKPSSRQLPLDWGDARDFCAGMYALHSQLAIVVDQDMIDVIRQTYPSVRGLWVARGSHYRQGKMSLKRQNRLEAKEQHDKQCWVLRRGKTETEECDFKGYPPLCQLPIPPTSSAVKNNNNTTVHDDRPTMSQSQALKAAVVIKGRDRKGRVKKDNKTTDWCHVAKGGCQHMCANQPDGPLCGCYQGYEPLYPGSDECVDIDECLEKTAEGSRGGCQQGCKNVPGTRRCACREGFMLINEVQCIKLESSGLGIVFLAFLTPILMCAVCSLVRMKLKEDPAHSRTRNVVVKASLPHLVTLQEPNNTFVTAGKSNNDEDEDGDNAKGTEAVNNTNTISTYNSAMGLSSLT